MYRMDGIGDREEMAERVEELTARWMDAARRFLREHAAPVKNR